jgi:hypothetical protein
MSDRLWLQIAVVVLLLSGSLRLAEAQHRSSSRATAPPLPATGQVPQTAPEPNAPAAQRPTPRVRSAQVPEGHQPRNIHRGVRHGELILLWPFGEVITPVVPVVGPPLPDTGLRGGLQLDVQPWRAEVYVDGTYAGLVEDFSGYYRHLEIAAGPHVITIVAPDHDPLVFEVMVSPGRTITHRATLSRAAGR